MVRLTRLLTGLILAAMIVAACAPNGAPAAPSEQAGPATATGAPQAAPTDGASEPGTANLQWSEPPAMEIDPSKFYIATFKTDKGDIVVELLADKALLERMVRAVEKVRQRMERVARALTDAGVPYAVAGGNAVAAWVATAVQSTCEGEAP